MLQPLRVVLHESPRSCPQRARLGSQFETGNAFEISQALKDYVNDIDAGQPGDPLTIEDIANGEDFLGWVKDGLVDAVFSDTKYNDEKMALWERNYLANFK